MNILKMRFHVTNNDKYKNISLSKLLVITMISFSLSGCGTVALLGTGAAVGGYVAGRDKHVTQSLADTKIDEDIKRRLLKELGNDALDVSVVTDKGCVLLTGNLPNDDLVSKAEEIARTVPDVVSVDNNITVGKLKTRTMLADDYITLACRTKLLSAKDVKSLNVKIKTMNHVVYLNGTARNNKELEQIICLVKNTKGVEKVVSYITLVGDEK